MRARVARWFADATGDPVMGRTQRVLLLSGLTGLIVGVVVVGMDKVAGDLLADPMADQPLWLRASGPAVGLVVAWAALRAMTDKASADTTEEYIRSIHNPPERLPTGPAAGRAVAGVGTVGYGGALGLDGPALYVGGVVGSAIQQRLARFFSREDAQVLMVAGAAAGIAALFKAPAAGAFFAVEVPHRLSGARRSALPAMMGAVAGYLATVMLAGTELLLPIEGVDRFDGPDLLVAGLLGLVCGLGARGFNLALEQTSRRVAAVHPLLRFLAASAVLFGLAYLAEAAFDRPLSLGAGYDTVEWLADPSSSAWLLLLLVGVRVAATLTTVGGGGVGGYIAPLLVVGAVLGRLCGQMLGMSNDDLFMAVGMAAFLGAGFRTPFAAVLLVAETTGQAGFLVPAVVATAVAQLLVGPTSVSPTQQVGRLGRLERRYAMPLASAVEADVRTVPPDATVAELVDVHLVGQRRRAVPVVDGDNRYLGLAALEEAVAVPEQARSQTPVAAITLADGPSAQVTWLVRDGVRALEEADSDLLPVTDGDGRFVGIVTTGGIRRLDEVLDKVDGSAGGRRRSKRQSGVAGRGTQGG